MGEMIEFPVNGSSAGGYLSLPAGGSGPGVMVVQEWWGLNDQIKGVADRLAGAGFVALAPDLYHGDLAGHDEMDKAGELMTRTVPSEQAARDMLGAVDHLLGLDATTGGAIGVIGFCMGGLLTLKIAALAGSKVAVAVPFYGAPLDDPSIDWSNLTAKVEGHFAEEDEFFTPEACLALAERLRAMGKDVQFHVYPGTGHAFANEENPLGSFNQAATDVSWSRAVELLESTLG